MKRVLIGVLLVTGCVREAPRPAAEPTIQASREAYVDDPGDTSVMLTDVPEISILVVPNGTRVLVLGEAQKEHMRIKVQEGSHAGTVGVARTEYLHSAR